MQRELIAFAEQYDAEADRVIDDHAGQISMNNPLLFLFVGDQSLEALQAVYDANTRKWNNSRGVLYLHVYQESTVERDNVFSFRLPAAHSDRKKQRPELRAAFYEDPEVLAGLNRSIRSVSHTIAEYGKLYSSFQWMNVATVARVDDPCSIMLPEIAILLKTILGESFKLIQMDFYGLIRERHADELSSALGVSFLREMDAFQDRAYSFKGPLRVTEDQVKLEVEHGAAPLFDLVYLLSDKNEEGMFPEAGMDANYSILCNMNLLKNRKIVEEDSRSQESYNNQHFRQHIQPSSSRETVYATAGFSRMKRPSKAIALTVASHLLKQVIGRLEEQSRLDRRSVAGVFGFQLDKIDRRVEPLLPGRESLEEMHGMLSESISSSELRRLTLGQAEERLFGEHAAAFFRKNMIEPAEKRLLQAEPERELQELVKARIINNPAYGLYSACLWTAEHDERSALHELHLLRKDTVKQLAEAEVAYQAMMQEPVEAQALSRFSLFEKTRIKQISRHIFDKLYGMKYDMLFLEMRMKWLDRCKHALEAIHSSLKGHVDAMKQLDKLLADTARQSVSEASDYLGRNIPEYYGSVVKEIMSDLQSRHGDAFLFDERYLGNVLHLLEQGADKLRDAVLVICKRDLFRYPQFGQSFEDELLQRANIGVNYEDRDKVLSKEELYRDLYVTLEDNAGMHMHIFNYLHKHRYEEKYFFADADSEFMQFAFTRDKGSRSYKLGCIHVPRSASIEKLNIMGGFQLDDMMYVINGRKYYESYQENGFQFHATT